MGRQVNRFRDIETGETITTEQLYNEYLDALQDGEHDGILFSEYVWNCLAINNGTLEAIQ